MLKAHKGVTVQSALQSPQGNQPHLMHKLVCPVAILPRNSLEPRDKLQNKENGSQRPSGMCFQWLSAFLLIPRLFECSSWPSITFCHVSACDSLIAENDSWNIKFETESRRFFCSSWVPIASGNPVMISCKFPPRALTPRGVLSQGSGALQCMHAA